MLFSSVIFSGCPGSSVLSSRRIASSLSLVTRGAGPHRDIEELAAAGRIPDNQAGFAGSLAVHQNLGWAYCGSFAKSPSPTTIRVIGRARSSTTDLPTVTDRSFEES